MVKTGFFNAVDDDKEYNADDISNFFQGIVEDGIFKNYLNSLQVITNEDDTMATLKSGKCIVKGKYILNTSDLDFTIDSATQSQQSRIDAIVAYADLSTRTAGFKYVKGSNDARNSSELIETQNYKAIPIAYLSVYYMYPVDIDDCRDESWIRLTNLIPTLTREQVAYDFPEAFSVDSNTGNYYIDLSLDYYNPELKGDLLNVYVNGNLLSEEFVMAGMIGSYYISLNQDGTHRITFQSTFSNTAYNYNSNQSVIFEITRIEYN